MAKTKVLKIDKDSHVEENWIKNYVKIIKLVCNFFEIIVKTIRMCNSKKKGLHFYITINPPVEPDFANLLQWLLGDDCARVDYNRARILAGLEEWNKLFENPDIKLKTIFKKGD